MAPAALLREVTQVLCAAGGALELEELRRCVRPGVGSDVLDRLLRERGRFVVARRAAGAGAAAVERVVLAVSPLRLCGAHLGPKPGCAGLCAQLHLCKFLFYGKCKFLRDGKECRNGHNLKSNHNVSVLKTHGVDHLNYGELCMLLFQNDPLLLPEICLHYNKGDGPYGSCSFKKHCIKLHVCQYFSQGECKFGTGCKRSHDFSNSENLEKLEKLGMRPELVSKLPSIYRNAHDIKSKSSASIRVPPPPSKSQETSDKCSRVHFHLPYRWQVLDGGKWKDLHKMELIEEAYSNPARDGVTCTETSSSFLIGFLNFDTMKFGATRARRLSTASSVTKPPHFILTTNWVWYWTDEFGSWQEYGRQGMDHPVTSITSSDLEKAYLAYCAPGSNPQAATLRFQAGKHTYELDFKAFIQKNVIYGTVRKVCRRPKYVSPQDVKMKQTWQKEQMQKRNGGKTVDERQLFHGTSTGLVDAICQQNFDWRVSGLHGTSYGKGNYFARDAAYSHHYSKTDTNTHAMFLARVLVGEFVRGSTAYVRPPIKEAQGNILYDSCVNSMSEPSIFVIFEKHQAYPEYVIQYTASTKPPAAAPTLLSLASFFSGRQ
ncbi:hypothetical protein G4228_011780 [Cervus hanglu yarkandensis]|nr:hypothetical protein G4228_011780 [Cervus hanglu yarkandensis]